MTQPDPPSSSVIQIPPNECPTAHSAPPHPRPKVSSPDRARRRVDADYHRAANLGSVAHRCRAHVRHVANVVTSVKAKRLADAEIRHRELADTLAHTDNRGMQHLSRRARTSGSAWERAHFDGHIDPGRFSKKLPRTKRLLRHVVQNEGSGSANSHASEKSVNLRLALTKGVVKLASETKMRALEELPEIFFLDHERIVKMQNDVQRCTLVGTIDNIGRQFLNSRGLTLSMETRYDLLDVIEKENTSLQNIKHTFVQWMNKVTSHSNRVIRQHQHAIGMVFIRPQRANLAVLVHSISRLMAATSSQADSDKDAFTQSQIASGARIISSSDEASNPPRRIRPAVNHHNNTTPPNSTWNGPVGWSVYFPDELETDQFCQGRTTVVNKLTDFFLTELGQKVLSAIPEHSFALPLDYHQLSRSSSPPVLRSIATAIEPSPEDALPSIGLAACRAAEQLANSPASIEGGGHQNRSAKCLYFLYLEANSISSSRQKRSAVAATPTPIEPQIEESETLAIHRVIREVVREKDPFGFLVQSLVPSIYGHEIVKAGMLLSLFGGAAKERLGPSGSESVSIRRDIHSLIVGDPGLGKSQMLKALSNVAPRGVYVCGNTTSTAGITVTVVREAYGDFALEAGALVLGDRGICCINEFDKMGAVHGALLEAMEQQSVSVAKAGLLCNLSARTTVIAAVNLVGGHYDRSRTVCKNLKIALPLLSRFDLVFILLDEADAARDRFISEHVMKIFGMRSTEKNTRTGWRKDGRVPRQDADHGTRNSNEIASQRRTCEGETTKSLQERLRGLKVRDPLPPSLFRQYIAYARTHVHPELSAGAKRELQNTYLQMRRAAHEQAADTTPTTTRQLESLIRLCEARARSVMRTIVTVEDAQDVIEIMRTSMVDTLTDETGNLDLGRSTGMSRSKDARRFINALNSEDRRVRNGVFDRRGLKRVAERIGISGDRLLETVNHQGYLMMRGGEKWELQGCEFGGDSAQGRKGQVSRSQAWGRPNQLIAASLHWSTLSLE